MANSAATPGSIESLRRAVNHWGGKLVDMLYPPVCMVCRQNADTGAPDSPAQTANLCHHCHARLPWLHHACTLCAVPLDSPADTCGPCAVKAPAWDRALSVFGYRDEAAWLLKQFKFQRRLAAGKLLALLAIEKWRDDLTRIDAIVPVPLHRRRLANRGFNQSRLLAQWIGQSRNISLDCSLTRTRPTPAQSTLDKAKRRANVRGAFAWPTDHPSPPRVLLLDDVLTTGATLAECTFILRQAGAERITVATMAKVSATG